MRIAASPSSYVALNPYWPSGRRVFPDVLPSTAPAQCDRVNSASARTYDRGWLVDTLPTNIERLAAPFSLEAVRQRHAAPADLEPTAIVPVQSARPHPRLLLVGGSSVPDPTPAQITDARERFLSRITGEPRPPRRTPVLAAGSSRPSMALLRRVPHVQWPDDGGRPGA